MLISLLTKQSKRRGLFTLIHFYTQPRHRTITRCGPYVKQRNQIKSNIFFIFIIKHRINLNIALRLNQNGYKIGP